MATRTFKGGDFGRPHDGYWLTGSDWSGDVAPQVGDTVVINAIKNTDLTITDGIYAQLDFGLKENGSTDVDVFIPGNPLTLGPDIPILVAHETIILNGAAGIPFLFMSNKSRLQDDQIKTIGTVVINAFGSNTVAGIINIGSAAHTSTLQIQINSPLFTGLTDLGGTIAIASGSTFNIAPLAISAAINVYNTADIEVAAGGVFRDNDLFGADGQAVSHISQLINDGTIDLNGAPGHTTKGFFEVDVAGTGTINANGHGAALSATKLVFNGSIVDQHIRIDDATVNVVNTFVGDSRFHGGRMTFAGPGELLLSYPAFMSSFPIYGFGAGDVLYEPDYGANLDVYTGAKEEAVWNPASHLLRVETVFPAGSGAEPVTTGVYALEGTYYGVGFHLQVIPGGDAETGLDAVSVTYIAPHTA